MKVHADTFKFSHTDEHGIDRHTVEVTIKGDRRTVRAHRYTNPVAGDTITVYDMAVKFKTGAKVWPGHADFRTATGQVSNLRPNIDKFGTVILVGFFEDFQESKARSLHNAVA